MNSQTHEWLNRFNKLVENEAFDDAVTCLTDNFEIAFSTPSFRQIYNTASIIQNQYYKGVFSKLILGWLCFVCGDNKRVRWVLSSIQEDELETPNSKSFLYSLKSFAKFIESQQEGLRYAKLSIDVLPKTRKNLVLGNAYMTYARQLTNVKRYRRGAEYFEKAYEIFSEIENAFLAITCFVNQCLNLYSLGKCKEVISKCQQILMFSSSQDSQIEEYINIVKLPMGMCYYEMNKIAIAIKALNEAKAGIDNLKLVHMHGLVEQYLFECYKIISDRSKMTEILESLESIFENLHYPQIKYLIISMKIKLMLDSGQQPKGEWIEELELAYQLSPESTPPFILEVLAELRIRGYSKIISTDVLIDKLEKIRYEGYIPQLQSISLYLAELFYMDQDIDTMKIHLRSACCIYKEYGLSIRFINRKLECFKYLDDIKPSVVNQLKRAGVNIKIENKQAEISPHNLTNRELEILRLICQGKSNKEISEDLFISIGTTKWHISNIFSKLDVKKRLKAVEKAKEINLTNP